jgi:hypothetical protein
MPVAEARTEPATLDYEVNDTRPNASYRVVRVSRLARADVYGVLPVGGDAQAPTSAMLEDTTRVISSWERLPGLSRLRGLFRWR